MAWDSLSYILFASHMQVCLLLCLKRHNGCTMQCTEAGHSSGFKAGASRLAFSNWHISCSLSTVFIICKVTTNNKHPWKIFYKQWTYKLLNLCTDMWSGMCLCVCVGVVISMTQWIWTPQWQGNFFLFSLSWTSGFYRKLFLSPKELQHVRKRDPGSPYLLLPTYTGGHPLTMSTSHSYLQEMLTFPTRVCIAELKGWWWRAATGRCGKGSKKDERVTSTEREEGQPFIMSTGNLFVKFL